MTEIGPRAPATAQVSLRPQSPGSGGSSRPIEVRVVRGRAELRQFLHFPWRIYAHDPAWVPPLLVDVRKALDRTKHPFHQHAEAEYFLAWRDGQVAGRIAAIIDHRFVEFQDERTGFFGLFETVDDPAVASALLATAEEWVRDGGMERIRGPMNLSTNEEICSPGILIEGYTQPPTILMGHNPPYYAALLEGLGYGKAKDLLAYWLDGPEPPERLVRGTARLQRAAGVSIRPVDLRRFREEVGIVQQIYNSAWERNWGFVPMSEAEFENMARQLRPVVDPDLCLIAEVEGEPIGFAVALPDYNQALKHLDGRLFPFGLLKLLWYRRQIDAARVFTLGLKPGYRHKGIDAMLYLRLFQEGPKKGYTKGECSWILEDNWEMRRGLERMGARVYKTYRVFEKQLPTT